MVALNLRVLSTLIPFSRIHRPAGDCEAICREGAAHAPMANIDANVLEFFSHRWPAIAAQAQTGLFLDVGQNDHIGALPAAGGTVPESPQATRADIQDLTQPVDREDPAMFFYERKPHVFRHSLGPMAFMPSLAREELGGFF